MAPRDAMMLFKADLDTCRWVVGHNIKAFDQPRLQAYFDRYNIACEWPIICDTMVFSKRLVAAKGDKGRLKNPKLEELYAYLFGQQVDTVSTHLADYDTSITVACCAELLRRGHNILGPATK